MKAKLHNYLSKHLILDQNGTLQIDENVNFELKRSFEWNDKKAKMQYMKSMAAFANNQGGIILFGIDDVSKEVVGCNKLLLIDSAEISDNLTRYFSSQIVFERQLFELGNTTIGALAIKKSSNKPILCIKDYDNILGEANIYYRYHGKSDKIKSGDLLNILEEVRQTESKKFLHLLSKIGRIGVDKVALLDTEKGEISNNYGNKFILSEELLRDIKVIDEYHSKERDGAPAVKIIGTVEVQNDFEKIKFVSEPDLLLSFLRNDEISEPEKYLEAICFQNSSKYPFYYLIEKTGKNIVEIIETIRKVNRNTFSKSKLIERMENDEKLLKHCETLKISTGTKAGKLRKKYYEKIKKEENLTFENTEELKRFLEAIFTLKKEEYNFSYLRSELKKVFENYYADADSNISSLIRSAISYIDLIENRR